MDSFGITLVGKKLNLTRVYKILMCIKQDLEGRYGVGEIANEAFRMISLIDDKIRGKIKLVNGATVSYGVSPIVAAILIYDLDSISQLKERISLLLRNGIEISFGQDDQGNPFMTRQSYSDYFERVAGALILFVIGKPNNIQNMLLDNIAESGQETLFGVYSGLECFFRSIVSLKSHELIRKAIAIVKNKRPDVYDNLIKNVILQNSFEVVPVEILEDIFEYYKRGYSGKKKDDDSTIVSVTAASVANDTFGMLNLDDLNYFLTGLSETDEKKYMEGIDRSWSDDDTALRLKKLQQDYNLSCSEGERMKRLQKSLASIKLHADDYIYLKVLNVIWDKGELSVRNSNVSFYKKLVEIVKKEIISLSGHVDNLKQYYTDNCQNAAEVYSSVFWEQYFFYKDKIPPLGEFNISINNLSRFGVGEIIDLFVGNSNTLDTFPYIERLWRKSNIVIPCRWRLYDFHKDIIDNGSQNCIEKAVECGLFPKPMRKKALDYAVYKRKNAIIPYLLYLNRA